MTRRLITVGMLALAFGVTAPASANAQGGLDPAFGDDGLLEVLDSARISGDVLEIYDEGPQAGKIVVGGYRTDEEATAFLARVNSDGSLDDSFGEGGIANLPGDSLSPPTAIALYGDGSIAYARRFPAVVSRVLSNGEPDTAFGEVDLDSSGGLNESAHVPDLAVDPNSDDLYVPLTASSYGGLGYYTGVVARVYRFDLDGSRDPGWAEGEFAPVNFDGTEVPILRDIEAGTDGTVWVGGYAHVSPGVPGVQRLTDEGEPDPALTPETDAGAWFDLPRDAVLTLALEPGESELPILATGEQLARVRNDGTLAPGSLTSTDPGNLGYVEDLEVDAAGRITTLLRSPSEDAVIVARLNPGGGLDPSFGFDGSTPLRWPVSHAHLPALEVTGSTQVVAGYAHKIPVTVESDPSAVVARFSDSADPVAAVPETSIVSGPAEGSTIADPKPTLGFASSEPRSSFECSVEDSDGPHGVQSCASLHTFDELSNGPVTVTVKAVSIYGVRDETPAERSFTINAARPETFIDRGPAQGATIRWSFARFKFSSSSEDAEFLCSLDGSPFRYCQSPRNFYFLKEGRHEFRVRAIDQGDRLDRSPAVRRFRVDTPAPDCDFYELKTPASLHAAAKRGITAKVVCDKKAVADLELRVTEATAEAFGLESRVIGSNIRRIPSSEADAITARLRNGVAEKLSRFPGATVYFAAAIEAKDPRDGDRASSVSRYGQFTVGR